MAHSLITTIQTTNNWKYKMIFDNEVLSSRDFYLVIDGKKKLTRKIILDIIKNNTVLNDFCVKKVQEYPFVFLSVDEVFWFIIKNFTFQYCKKCGKLLTYKQILHHHVFCSRKCSTSSKEVRNKIKQTCLQIYGVDSPAKSKEVQAKIRQTCINKYGVSNAFQTEKTKITLIKKYGVDNPAKAESVKEKIKSTNLQIYGVDNPARSKEVQAKIRQTCINKYGTDCTLKAPKIKNKAKTTIQEKYGVNCVFQSPEIKNKITSTIKERYDVDHHMHNKEIKDRVRESRIYSSYERIIEKLKDYVIPLFAKDDYDGIHYYDKKYRWKCIKCGNEFEDHIYSHIPRCLNCYPIIGGTSRGEQELIEFCKQYYPNLIAHDKTLIKPYELDIVIPELKITLEFNGKYWHSIDKRTIQDYHLMKTEMCENLGYRLIHIFEDEWNKDKEEIKFKLNSIFNNTFSYSIQNDEIVLDRCWYSKNTEINGFYLAEITEPELMQNNCYNCGKLIYKRNEETK